MTNHAGLMSAALKSAITIVFIASPAFGDSPSRDVTSPPPSLGALSALGIDPTGVRCERMEPEALVAKPPPPPSSNAFHQPVFSRNGGDAVCPAGYVPKYNDPVDGDGLEALSMSYCPTNGTYYWAGRYQVRTSTTGYGVYALIRISNPALRVPCDMSVGEISVVKGDNNQSVVEVGMRKFWHSYPKLMIGHWRGGYFRNDDNFVYVHPTYSNDMSLSSFVGTSKPFSIHYSISQGNWWVWFNDAWVGYFPGYLWNGAFTRADTHHWYGEVYSAYNSIPPVTDMGTGYPVSMWQAAGMSNSLTLDHNEVWAAHSTNYVPRIIPDSTYYDLLQINEYVFRYGGDGE